MTAGYFTLRRALFGKPTPGIFHDDRDPKVKGGDIIASAAIDQLEIQLSLDALHALYKARQLASQKAPPAAPTAPVQQVPA